MWLSLNIISDITDIQGISAEEIAHKLTMSTAEIEGIEYLNRHLKTVIAARIENILPHPNADKLTLVDLDAGAEKIRVVCGAPNHKKGDIAALAQIGTVFNEDFEIKKTKIRGESSEGMLCSKKELGLSDDHSGIMILPENTPIGKPLCEIFKNRMDIRLDIDNKSLTHRPDLWCHAGFAREISALFNTERKEVVNYNISDAFKDLEELKVAIKNPEVASRYCGLIVKNIKIAESPDWLKAKVASIGMRPINNIVDITNYVMAEIGEPMHAFDRKKLAGNEILVRIAENGEIIKTLDGQTHKLTSEDIIIADESGPIALAGVMGGADSEVDENTTEIILEAANFDPIRIRKTAGRYNLRTEAAVRFEKSLDPELCGAAIIRCFELIKEIIPEAVAATKLIDCYPVKRKKVTVNTDADFIRRKIGNDIDDNRIIYILKSLGFAVIERGGLLDIEVPTHRATGDISTPDDIVEEVGRIYGYDNIEPKAPLIPSAPAPKNKKRLFERQIKNILVRDHRIIEVSNYSFIGENLLNKLNVNENMELTLRNPLSLEHDRLRRSLLPNLINNIILNRKYSENFRIFELGKIFIKADIKSPKLAVEETFVSGLIFSRDNDDLFYDIKNIVNDLLSQLRVKNSQFISNSKNFSVLAHPARNINVVVDKKEAGCVFELHPKIISDLEINGRVGVFDLNMDTLFSSEKKEIKFAELPKFPDVPFEISVLAEKYTYVGEIISIINSSNEEYIKSIDVISVYEGSPILSGMKSVSFKIIFSAKEKTLSAEEIEKLQNSVIKELNKKGYKLR